MEPVLELVVESTMELVVEPMVDLLVELIVDPVGEPMLDIIAQSQPEPNHDNACVVHGSSHVKNIDVSNGGVAIEIATGRQK